jgi:hypothetical protein
MLNLPTIMGTAAEFPRGSPEWLTIKANLMVSQWRQNKRDSDDVHRWLRDLLEHKAWRYLPAEKPINDPRRFLKALLDAPADTVIEIVARGDVSTRRELNAMLAEERAKLERPGGANNPSGRNQHTRKAEEVNDEDFDVDQKRVAPGIQTPEYILKRIARLAQGEPLRKRDPATGKLVAIPTTPDTQRAAHAALDGYRRGELSPREAGLRLGLIQEPDIVQQLLRLWAKATPEQRAAFTREIVDQDANGLARACFV